MTVFLEKIKDFISTKKGFYLLLIYLLIVNSTFGQNCSFTVDVSVNKVSDCESNGIIKAVLKGSDVASGNIQLSDAKYSIASVIPGGYNKTFDVNGGVLQGVPPGTYTITAEAYCKKTNSWVMATSPAISLTGTYPGFDINKIMIESASMNESLKCSATGSIPIKLGSGKKPYSVEIVEAPDPSYVGNTYTSANEGTLTIDKIPSGNYKFAIYDDCGYTIFLKTFLDKIDPEYKVLKTEDTPVCTNNGSIQLSLKNGTLPYTITITNAPPEYTGPTAITVLTDGNYTITGLPAGTYAYTVNDLCHPETFTSTINKVAPNMVLTQQSSSALCLAEGEINFKLSGGLAPYTIKPILCPSVCPFDSIIVSSAKDTIIKGFLPGNYTFSLTDQCQDKILTQSITIDTVKMQMKLTSTNVTSCNANDGTATITITGGTPAYNASMLNLATNTPIALPAGPPYNFTNLSPGNYKFKIKDGCGSEDSITFAIVRDSLIAVVVYGLSSFECKGIGTFSVQIVKGQPDYKVEIMTGPPGFAGIVKGPTTDTEIKFEDLRPGPYLLQVTDACDTLMLPAIVDTLEWTNYADLYEDFFYLPDPLDLNCEKLGVKRKHKNSTAFEKLWSSNPELFEVAFVPSNNTLPPWTWRAVKETDTVSFNTGYCDARNSNLTFEAHVRFKAPSDCDTLTDIIKFKPLLSEAKIIKEYCEGFDIEISHDPNNVICLPYTYFVTDTTSGVVVSQGTFNDLKNQKVTNLPHGTHIVSFTDREGCVWVADTISSNSPRPSKPTEKYIDLNCDNYSIQFTFKEKCYPYSWVITERDRPSVIIGNKDINDALADPGTHYQRGLQYGVYYKLCIVSNQNKDTTCTEIFRNRIIHKNYKIDSKPSYCLPDTAKGYIRLFRDNNPSDFEKGSIIRFISGPTIPIHTQDTIKVTNIKEYFPFCTDSLSAELVDIKEGEYVFEITDSCKVVHEIKLDYKRSKVIGFGYDPDESCNGIYIKPKGSIYWGNTKIKSYFRIITTPPGVAPNTNVVTEPGSLLLPETGRYTLQISAESGTNSCPFDTLVIDYIKQTLSLDADSTRTYVCEEGSDGYINVKHKGGIGPFTYELFDQGISKGKNTTGIFYYGKFGESYIVRITDEGCGVSFPVDVYMLDLSKERLISSDQQLCRDEQIELKCISVGTYIGYNWSGPNGFNSTDQNPVIPNATTAMNGKYTITIHPEGCSRPITQEVNIKIIDPLPLPDTTIVYCIGDIAVPLTAVPEAGNHLKWYQTDTTHVALPPTPPTHIADTMDYFVSQVNSILGCEGEKSVIRVIIQDFPDTVAYAFSNDICPNDFPLITIPETFNEYVYRLYSASGIEIARDTATGDTLRINSSVDFAASGYLFVEVETKHRCVSREKSKVPVGVVNPPAPVVYDVLYCLYDYADILIADSTTGNRLQWYAPDMSPLVSAPAPPTDIAGVFSYFVSQVDTLLGCEGQKTELKVTIIDLPDTAIKAYAPNVCMGSSPTFIIENTFANYKYTVFNAWNDTIIYGISNGSVLNLSSPALVLLQNDTFYIEIQNQHRCTSKDRAKIPVKVEIPPLPKTYDTLYCVGDIVSSPKAIPTTGYSLKWYDEYDSYLPTLPTPSTAVVDTFIYKVSQIHNILGCESEKIPLQVIIIALPDTVTAYAPPICPGQHPTIEVANPQAGYVYKVYSASGSLVTTKAEPGNPFIITVYEIIKESTHYYVESVNTNGCASDKRATVYVLVENYMYIMPDKIPVYQRDRYYSYQLESNAVSPYEFKSDDMLPLGFTLSIGGVIAGTPPRNGLIDPIPFVVKVVDVNGCFAEKEYVLESDIFVPQVFTPNGDGKNDIFMKGRRLVIFDRLGLKIYEGDDGWDGTRMDGTPAPPDTYFYLLYYEDENLMTEGRKKGYITLVRRK